MNWFQLPKNTHEWMKLIINIILFSILATSAIAATVNN